MEPFCSKLYTIELSSYYYINTKNKYKGNKIEFINGDRSEVFKTLLPSINENSIFLGWTLVRRRYC
jgi:hypothetical protein